MEISKDHIRDIETYFEQHQSDMLAFLETLVCIQSGSRNKAGVDRMAAVLAEKMGKIGFRCERVKNRELGDHLIARMPGGENQSQILLVGHMDTVFPEDTPFNWFRQDETKSYGPGVIDMKGGLVVGIFALKYLVENRLLDDVPVTFTFNSDEEIGSPSSWQLICDEAEKSCIGFVFEAGGLDGQIVTGRKGNITARIDVKGKAGHAAFAGPDKASAILEMAHKTISIEALNNPEQGISANVGTVEGGIGPNTVPEYVSAKIDFRFPNPGGEKRLKTALEKIVKISRNKGVCADLTYISERQPMPQTQENLKVFNWIKDIAGQLDIPVQSEIRQGVSDANLIIGAGIPVIDGLGPIGAKDHSTDEYMVTQSLVDRTRLFTHIMIELISDLKD